MKEQFLVQGSCGEYEDYGKWLVWAFTDRHKALAYCNALNNAYAAQGELASEAQFYNADAEVWAPMKKLDPRFDTDYTGTNYTVTAISAPKGLA